MKILLLFLSCVYICMCERGVHVECNAPGRQKKVSEILELELEAVVICSVWVLEPQLLPTVSIP